MSENISKQQVDAAFDKGAKGRSQGTVLYELYKLAGIDLKRSKKVTGWPKAGNKLHRYIGGRFTEFDKVYHPEVLPGGLWYLGSGFSSDDELGDWEVDISHLEIEMEGDNGDDS